MIAEELPDAAKKRAAARRRKPPQFTAAKLYLTYSNDGLNGCAVAFQRHARDRVVTWPAMTARGLCTTTAGSLF